MSEALLKNLDQFIADQHLLRPHDTIIVGLSGGPDSVALLHYLVSCKRYTIIAAHLDHGWRATSTHDAQFCADLCTKLGITYKQEHLCNIPARENGSPEDTARRARRTFFEQCAREYNAQAIALAQHRDDQRETFFLRLIRGASVTGLAGIRPRNGLYIRPLLNVTKREILAYLHEHDLAYCIDETNTDPRYLRNTIRKQLIHALDACDTRALHNLDRTIEQLQEVDDYIEQTARDTYARIMQQGTLKLSELLSLHPVLEHRVLMLWFKEHHVPFTPTQAFFAEVRRFLEQPGSATHHMHTSWSITKKNGLASITTTIKKDTDGIPLPE